MVFVGCGDSDPDPDGNGDDNFVHNLGPRTLELGDNYQYGKGYQGVATWAALFAGNQVKAGDEFTLRMKFTVDRDLTDELFVGLVDPTPAADYWKPLTWPGGDDSDPELLAGEAADDGLIKAGKEYEFEITMTALVSSTSAAAAANALVFQTDCAQGTPGTGNSGVLGKITVSFTELIFARGPIDVVPEPDVDVEFTPPTAIAPPAGSLKLGDYTVSKAGTPNVDTPTNLEYQITWGLNAAMREAILEDTLGKLYMYVDLEDVADGFGGWEIIFQIPGDGGWQQVNAPWGGWKAKNELADVEAITIAEGIICIVIDLSTQAANLTDAHSWANVFVQTTTTAANQHNAIVVTQILAGYLAP